MELALHLGMTVGELEERMSEAELTLWMMYAHSRMLPWRRMELYLAQVAQRVSWLGGGDATLADFVFDDATEDDGLTAEEFFGFAPRASKSVGGNAVIDEERQDGD